MKVLAAQKKEFTLKCIKEALAIAGALYQSDRQRYKMLFAWINTQAKKMKSPVLVLQTLKRLQEKEASANKALDVAQYLGGTLRKLEHERESKQLRSGGGMSAVKTIDVFAQLLRQAGYTVEKNDET